MLADYHMHTSFSDDSSYPMSDCIHRAISLGFDEICFTEHIDYGITNAFCCDVDAYYSALKKYQQQFKNIINIKFGIEFGAQAHHKKYFERIFNSYPFDFALLSFHQVEDKELWNHDFQSGKSQSEYYRIYYEEILNTIKVFDGFSVLAHMDLLRRYDRYGEYPFENSKDQIEEILRYLIDNGKGIELNTSSYRYNLSDLTPSTPILKLYKKLGGEIITIGSDSHRETQVGERVKEAKEILKNYGYEYFTTFDKMEPEFHKL